jgi:hypothetical protein
MSKNKKIYWVEQRHIDKAGKYSWIESPTINPVSIAIKERLHRDVVIVENDDYSSVYESYYTTSSGNDRSFNLCKKGLKLLQNWANGKKVKPTEITITLID